METKKSIIVPILMLVTGNNKHLKTQHLKTTYLPIHITIQNAVILKTTAIIRTFMQ